MNYFKAINITTNLLILLLLSSVVPAQANDMELEEFAMQSRKNAADFISALKRTRSLEIETVGLFSTLETCRHHAPQLYFEYSVKNNIMIRRVSLAPRNPVTGGADAWEQAGLLKMQKMLKEGGKANEMEIVELVQEPAEEYYRYLKPIVAEPDCLKCHGTEKDISKEAADAIKLFYPKDRATGYIDCDLVGAVSIKRAKGVAPPPEH
ncbi:MAG: DUF3365 domain-containing protein [Pseudomonadota bacterium]|nr:DUF3365 domain-containing protein [Pseudomonadota bacterium]